MGIRVSLIQMSVVGGDKLRNLARAEELIAEAARNGAELALLPEALDLGWTHPSCRAEAEPIPSGMPAQRLLAAAAEHRIYLCAGLTERDGERVFNSALIAGPSGELLCLHRKLNELTIGHDCYAQGDRLNVVHTELGTLGLLICADGFAEGQVLSRALCYMGADIVLSPSAWAVPTDHDNTKTPYGGEWLDVYVPVARRYRVWFLSTSNVGRIDAGPWAGRKCIGCSMAIGPDGAQVLRGPYGEAAEAILYVDVTPVPRPARGCGWAEFA